MSRQAGKPGKATKWLAASLAISFVWTAISTWVGWFAVGPGFPDGFQSVGPIFGGQAGHLAWPMMGGFEGFDRAWGYHWVGWPMLRSLAGLVVPWTALGDGIALHLLRALVAVLVGGCLLRQLRSASAAWVGMLTVLLNRGWFCSMAFLHRPETLTALLLWMAAIPLIGERGGRSKAANWLSVFSLVLLPLMHPLAWPAALIVAGFGSLSVRQADGDRHWIRHSFMRWWLPLIFGFSLFAAYYLTEPVRLSQLKDTLQTSSLIKSGLGATARRLFLDPKNIFFSGPVLAVLGISLIAAIRRPEDLKSWARDGLGVSLVLVGLSMGYLLVAGHPNTGHATVMAPFLGYAAGRLFHLEWRSKVGSHLIRTALAGQVFGCGLPLVLTAFSFVLNPPSSPRKTATDLLARALSSTNGLVVIPVSLWEAAGSASAQDRERIRFVTFPNWVPIDRRLAYEAAITSSLLEGDILIVEETPYESSDPGDILPWPRTPTLRGQGGWQKQETSDAIVNTTLSIGNVHRKEMLLGPMALLRYHPANRINP